MSCCRLHLTRFTCHSGPGCSRQPLLTDLARIVSFVLASIPLISCKTVGFLANVNLDIGGQMVHLSVYVCSCLDFFEFAMHLCEPPPATPSSVYPMSMLFQEEGSLDWFCSSVCNCNFNGSLYLLDQNFVPKSRVGIYAFLPAFPLQAC